MNKNYQIIWAAGPKQYETIQKSLSEANININEILRVKILPYIYNMEEVMSACDLVVCRSGALTITEISIIGKPAIFVPLPFAAENHQEYNAKVLVNQGAARIILDKDLNQISLNEMIDNMIKDRTKLKQMGENAKRIAVENVEDKIYKEIKMLIKD